jgi:hypothetical protein
MLLSKHFDIVESFHSHQIYQDMTRYRQVSIDILLPLIFSLIAVDHYAITTSILPIIRMNLNSINFLVLNSMFTL